MTGMIYENIESDKIVKATVSAVLENLYWFKCGIQIQRELHQVCTFYHAMMISDKEHETQKSKNVAKYNIIMEGFS